MLTFAWAPRTAVKGYTGLESMCSTSGSFLQSCLAGLNEFHTLTC